MRVFGFAAGLTGIKRFAALFALLALVCLPFHFHSLTAPAQIAKECACAHGTRAELGLPSPPAEIAPVIAIESLVPRVDTDDERLALSVRSIRAPPAFIRF
jgi:hypothetical protein